MVGVRAFALIAAALAGACTSGAPPAQAPPRGSAAPETPPPIPAVRLVHATVYDSAGHAVTCASPLQNCPNSSSDTAFFDRCRLAGFQVRRCGCRSYCSGKVPQNLAYAADGGAKPCAPADNHCTPPDTSAAFQDACTDAGHRLEVCGCEWLCSGPPKH